MKKLELRKLIKEEIQKLNETGEMNKYDIQKGGEYYEWAKEIEKDIKKIQRATKGILKFKKMEPYDKYQGPYAVVTINGKIDNIWSMEYEDLFIEDLKLLGSWQLLSKALMGDPKALKITKKNKKK